MRHVLVRKSERSLCYVQQANPTLETQTIYEALRFETPAMARALKRALQLDRDFAVRTLPEWFR